MSKPTNRAEVLSQVLTVIKNDLQVDATEATLVKDLGDSLDVMEVLMQVEDKYAIKLATDGLNTVADLVNNIAAELKLAS
ncbi:MAG: acyl carrier protein [Candidatus Obscuribacterales bacterium]|nr:acyl carrier protein [Candidatus Obscuribacterales bacterium]